MSKIYHDITVDFSPDTVVYEGDFEVEIIEDKSISKGDMYNLSIITFGSHTGTHIDAPKHFYDNGMTVDELPMECLIGCVKVLEIKDMREIDVNDLKAFEINKGDRILLKTKNSSIMNKEKFSREFAYITPSAAEYLVDKGIITLGFDYLSVEKYDADPPDVHYILLKNNVVIIEGLDLSKINSGGYEMVALPMKIKNGNGSPARVVLIEEGR